MKIVVAGGSGFIGEALVRHYLGRGDVAVLTRDPAKARLGSALEWHPPAPGSWEAAVGGADLVINLAGENIGSGRWSEKKKQRLLSSRLAATEALVRALRKHSRPGGTFFSASAVGFYGDRGDEELTESSGPGEGFLAGLTRKWEAAAGEAGELRRLIVGRFGVVIDTGGGMLEKLMLPFRLGLGGPAGNGRQWVSWVDRVDLVRMVDWLVSRPDARGIYNVTAPGPVTQRELAKTLGKVLHRPAVLPAPAFGLRLAFGQMADEMLLASQRAHPERARQEGFEFEYPDLEASLRRALA
ncbi:MAG TPA: TIGR01777 family oxidoreductase [Thermoanaerobaculia bacterium]|nr:TIGR01777 family oxidoreductase [Thermoanaerobaculia bacterium]